MRVRGAWFRHHAPEIPATRGTTRAWRWNLAGILTLYLASSKEACRAEIARLAASAGVRMQELLPRELTTFEIELGNVSALRNPGELKSHGLTIEDVRSTDFIKCQGAGGAIERTGREGLVAISSVGEYQTLAVFLANLQKGSILSIAAREELT